MQKKIKKIAIVGGGTAGWSAAALLAHQYQNHELEIVLIESPGIPPVGVGEATVPAILNVHNKLQIDEREFIKETQATFKLGIEFQGWAEKGSSFFHPFSDFGVDIEKNSFYRCWLKLKQEGYDKPLQDFSLCTALAKSGKFAIPDNESSNSLAWYGYAYHFDASKYAKFLKKYSEGFGVKCVKNTVVDVKKDNDTGFLKSLIFESGDTLTADFFVDCSGFKSLLLEKQCQVGYEDWSHWLPCDRAWAVQTDGDGDIPSYTLSKAMSAGWSWRIPLQNRYGNGYVFSSRFIDEDAAKEELINNLFGATLTEPRLLSFRAGMRPKFWVKNCAAVGLSSGFIEPLESTSISLMHTGVAKIIAHLPDLVLREEGIDRANDLNRKEYERIRDFIILHYWASKRSDSPFWRSFKEMELPDKLSEKINAFIKESRLLLFEQESFKEPSWLAMYSGFDLVPDSIGGNVNQLSPDFISTI